MGVKRKLVTQKDCHFCQHVKVLRTSPLTTMKWCVLAILDEVMKLHPNNLIYVKTIHVLCYCELN
jgi:hypothetical protein